MDKDEKDEKVKKREKDERVYWKSDNIYGAIFDYRISLMYGVDCGEYRETDERNKRTKYRQLMSDLKADNKWDIKKQANQVYSRVRLVDSQVLLQTAILLFLNSESDKCNTKKIQEKLSAFTDGDTKELICVVMDKQLRQALQRLVSSGMIYEKNKKKPEIYRLNENIFAGINYEKITNALDFAGRALPFSGLIHSLPRIYDVTHSDYAVPKSEERKGTMSFEHISTNQILDEYVLWVMMSAYSNGKAVVMNYYNSDSKDYQAKVCIPVRCVYDVLHNRVYFVAYDCECQRISIFRADRILGPKVDDSVNAEEIRNTDVFRVEEKKALRCIEKSWMVSMNSGLEDVELRFPNNPYIKRRVENECRNAKLLYFDESIILNVAVNDPKELLPWIRTFGTDCTIVKPESLVKQEIGKMKEMVELYEYEL